MNLADMLAFSDIQQLNRIAELYECDCSTNSKHELIQSVLSKINRRDVFDRMVHSLSVEDLRFLNVLLFDKRDAFSLEELLAWASQTKFQTGDEQGFTQNAKTMKHAEAWHPRDTISKFKQRGWLFNGHSHQTKYLFTVPRDLKKRIGDRMGEHFLTQVVKTDSPPVYREEHQLLLEDIRHFLAFVYKHDIALTSDGYIYKRQLQQILQTLQVEEALPSKATWRFGYGRKMKEYPNRFSFIYDFCYFHEYIAEHHGELGLTPKGEAFLAGNPTHLMEVYRFWIRLYKGPIYNLQALVHWISRLAMHWSTVQSLKQILCPLIKPYYYDMPESILEQRILHMMMHLGLLSIGEHTQLGSVVRMTKLGQEVINGTYIDAKDQIKFTSP